MVENPLFVAALAVLTSLLASSGFWAYVQRKGNNKEAQTRLLIGLSHEIIVYLCGTYIEQGWIAKEEYDTLIEKLYKPYLEMGGNGLAAKVIEDVGKLPIKTKEKND